jgi:hypothetical protein
MIAGEAIYIYAPTEDDIFCSQKIFFLIEEDTFSHKRGYFCSQKIILLHTEEDTFAHR